MATTFDVFYLGNFGSQLDTVEGNDTSENAASLVGTTLGSGGNPLYDNVQSFAVGSTGYSSGTATDYDTDNSASSDTFCIDAGADQTLDSVVTYNAEITYVDGNTALIQAIVMQDVNGNLYLAPDTAAGTSYQNALEAKPIETLEILSVQDAHSTGLAADRAAGDFMQPDNLYIGGSGSDTLIGSDGDDHIYGGDGTDTIMAKDGDDVIDAGHDAYRIYAGDGNDTLSVTGGTRAVRIDGEAGDDTFTISDVDLSGNGVTDSYIGGGDGNDTLNIHNSTVDKVYGSDTSGFATGGSGADVFHITGDSVVDDKIWVGYNHPVTGGTDEIYISDTARVNSIEANGSDQSFDLTISDFGVLGDGLGDGARSSNWNAEQNVTLTESGAIDVHSEFSLGGGDDSISFTDTSAFYGNEVSGGAGNDTLTFADNAMIWGDVEGDAGNDTITVTDNATVTGYLAGDDGNDTIYGGDSDDVAYGGADEDSIYGGAGHDYLVGDGGDDLVEGGDGHDTLYGGDGGDTLYGEAGNDLLYSGNDDDTLYGGAGDDALSGGNGNDTLDGGTGFDNLNGGGGDDFLYGGDGNDLLTGGNGTDTLYGGADRDYLYGGADDDLLYGGSGNDAFYSGTGNDIIDAGAGDDYISLTSGNDTLYGGDDRENIHIIAGGFDDGAVVTVDGGTGGNDYDYLTLTSWTAHRNLSHTTDADGDSISGSVELQDAGGNWITVNFTEIEDIGIPTLDLTPDYTVSGTSGADTIDVAYTGDPQNEMIDNGDSLTGNDDDYVEAGAGNDTILSGAGNDVIVGGIGDDAIYSGTGADTIVFGDGDGADVVHDFDMTDSGDGTTVDQFDVTGLTTDGTTPVTAWDVVVTDTVGDGSGDAVLTFPNGESVTLTGVRPDEVDTAGELNAIGIPCFTAGAQIETSRGEVPVETLRIGDMVRTWKHGFQPVRWVGSRVVTAFELAQNPNLNPIVIRKQAFNNRRKLVVSPQHGMVVDVDGEAVLIRAKHLAEFFGGSVARVQSGTAAVTYYHFMCDQHQIVFADGCLSEAFYPGKFALSSIGHDVQTELFTLFPELIKVAVGSSDVAAVYSEPALHYLKRREVAALGSFRKAS